MDIEYFEGLVRQGVPLHYYDRITGGLLRTVQATLCTLPKLMEKKRASMGMELYDDVAEDYVPVHFERVEERMTCMEDENLGKMMSKMNIKGRAAARGDSPAKIGYLNFKVSESDSL